MTYGIVLGLTLGCLLMGSSHPAQAQSGDTLAPASPSLTAPAEAPGQLLAPQDPDNPDQGVTPPEQAPGQSLNLGTQDTKDKSTSIDPKDIPQVLLDEMQEIEDNCTNSYFYASFHNCHCIAVKFLDARMKSDPDTPKERVFANVAAQCVDEPSIAGYIYKSCAEYMENTRHDYVSFCKCSANNVAKAYGRTPLMNMRYIEGLRRNAFITCGLKDNPDFVKSPYLDKN